MTVLVIRYDNDGSILGYRNEVNHDYEPGPDEFIPETEPDVRNLESKKVDTSVDPPEIVDNPKYVKTESVRRDKVSQQTKDAFRNAKGNNDLQAQLDVLFEILTGEAA